jgi:hypothetical protein
MGPAFGHNLPQRVFEGDQFLDQPAELPWEDRKRIAFTVPLTATLGTLIDQAADEWGVRRGDQQISVAVPMIYFYGDGKQHGFIRTVESDGQPGWALRWSDIQIAELIASADAGLLEGDPRRPIFWPVIPQAVFADLAGALLYMWTMWEHYLAARETTGLARVVIERLRRGRAAGGAGSAQPSLAWHEAFRRVNDLMSFLDEARTTDEVATRMGTSLAEAEGTLLALGFTRHDDGRWRAGGDVAAEIVHEGLLDLKRDGPASSVHDDAGPRSEARIREAEESLGP